MCTNENEWTRMELKLARIFTNTIPNIRVYSEQFVAIRAHYKN